MRWLSGLFAALALAALAGCGNAEPADITLRYAVADNPEDRLLIEAESPDRMRIEDGRGRMVLVRGDETFLIFEPPAGGRAAARLDDYLAVGAEVRQRMMQAGAMVEGSDNQRYTARQEGTRNVGSWQGAVWSIDPIEPPGVTQELVISDDPALADLRAVAAAALDAFDQPSRAVLVFPDEYIRLTRETIARGMPISLDGLDLQNISREPVPDERFEFTETVLSRDQLRALLAR